MELGSRKKKILSAIINDYIESAEPVGSRTIAKKYEIGLSSATIRNEMADLEELGYLEQPHTSAGRVPSDKGYRLYVDELIQINKPSDEEAAFIKDILQLTTINEINKIMLRTAKLISQITKLTSAVLSPSVNKSAVKSIQLIQVTPNDIVAVVLTDTGIFKNVVIKTPRPILRDTLSKISSMLNEKLIGLTIEEIDLSIISSIQAQMRGYTEIFNAVIPVLYESLKEIDCEVYMDGATNIFNYPEYSDNNKARDFLSIVENREILMDIFSEQNKNLSVSIGHENEFNEIKDYSIVKSSYKIGNRNVGSIGVIGPKRMNYSHVMGTLNYLTQTLNNILKNSLDEF